ncbi:MAG: hypothetical protein Kapaf2KO_07490 [Candidatus Kapaibacteriales bacterium]
MEKREHIDSLISSILDRDDDSAKDKLAMLTLLGSDDADRIESMAMIEDSIESLSESLMIGSSLDNSILSTSTSSYYLSFLSKHLFTFALSFLVGISLLLRFVFSDIGHFDFASPAFVLDRYVNESKEKSSTLGMEFSAIALMNDNTSEGDTPSNVLTGYSLSKYLTPKKNYSENLTTLISNKKSSNSRKSITSTSGNYIEKNSNIKPSIVNSADNNSLGNGIEIDNDIINSDIIENYNIAYSDLIDIGSISLSNIDYFNIVYKDKDFKSNSKLYKLSNEQYLSNAFNRRNFGFLVTGGGYSSLIESDEIVTTAAPNPINNLNLGVFYELNTSFDLGIVYRQETFNQSFTGIENGVNTNYFQQLPVKSILFSTRYKFIGEKSITNGLSYVPFVIGGIGTTDDLFKGSVPLNTRIAVGTDFRYGSFLISPSIDLSNMIFSHQGSMFNSSKIGYSLDFGVRF